MPELQVLRDWKVIESLLPAGWENLACEHESCWKTEVRQHPKVHESRGLDAVLAGTPTVADISASADSGGLGGRAGESGHQLRGTEQAIDPLGDLPAGPGHTDAGTRGGCIAGDVGGLRRVPRGREHGLPPRLALRRRADAHAPTCGRDALHARGGHEPEGGKPCFATSYQPGSLVIKHDRGYCQAAGIIRSVQKGADVLVRLNRGSTPLELPSGSVFDLLPWLRQLHGHRADEQDVVIRWTDASKQTHLLDARVCAVRLPAREAEEARQQLRKEHGSTTSPGEIAQEVAGYVALLTTAPTTAPVGLACRYA